MSALCLPSVTNSLTRRKYFGEGYSRRFSTPCDRECDWWKEFIYPPADILVSLLVMCCGWVEQDNSLALVTFDAHALLWNPEYYTRRNNVKDLWKDLLSPRLTELTDFVFVNIWLLSLLFQPSKGGGCPSWLWSLQRQMPSHGFPILDTGQRPFEIIPPLVVTLLRSPISTVMKEMKEKMICSTHRKFMNKLNPINS